MIGSQSMWLLLVWSKETTCQALARTLTKLLNKYGLQKKKFVYVKDEGSNFNAMFAKFKYVVSCESFGLKESLQGTCFGHFFKGMSIWNSRKKASQKIEICFYLIYARRLAKVHHLAQEVWKR